MTVTYLQFQIQVCFSAKIGLSRLVTFIIEPWFHVQLFSFFTRISPQLYHIHIQRIEEKEKRKRKLNYLTTSLVYFSTPYWNCSFIASKNCTWNDDIMAKNGRWLFMLWLWALTY